MGVSQRRTCKVVGQHRSTQRKLPTPPADEKPLTSAIIRLAQQYGRYGYRRITALLRNEGWVVNVKRVERIWRREGLKVPQRQPKRGRLWFNDGSCVRLRPQYSGHVWSYDFVMDRTHDGKAFRMLTVIDEHSRQCLAIHVQRKLKSDDVLAVLTELFQRHGPPDHIRSDNGAEFTANAVRDWLGRIGVKTLYIEPGSPWENGYNESFNGKLRDADSDDAAHPFRSDRAHHSDLMPPGWGADRGAIFTCDNSDGQAACAMAFRRMESPESSRRWALWTRRSRMASA